MNDEFDDYLLNISIKRKEKKALEKTFSLGRTTYERLLKTFLMPGDFGWGFLCEYNEWLSNEKYATIKEQNKKLDELYVKHTLIIKTHVIR